MFDLYALDSTLSCFQINFASGGLTPVGSPVPQQTTTVFVLATAPQ
ncbi:MAG: hypothetical protein ABSG38_00735 [Spirochaetia bacterium]|jgi:hypothetical protein